MKPVPFPTPEEIDKIKLFFIIGRPRSGTTLLRTLLDAHPNVIVPTECPFILQLAKRYRKINKLSPKIIDKYISDLQQVWLFNLIQIDIDKLKINLLNYSGNIDYITLCKIVILHSPAIFPKEQIIVIGDKNPSYAIRFKKLFKLLGKNCKYIFIYRDFRDQFISLKKLNIEFPFFSTAALRWKYVQKLQRRFQRLYPSNVMSVKYEDLASFPETELIKVNDFIGIPYNSEVLLFHKKKHEIEQLYTKKVMERTHQSLLNPIKPNRSGLWKSTLNSLENDISVLISGKELKFAGYEVPKINKKYKAVIYSIPGIALYHFSWFLLRISYLLPMSIFLKVSQSSALGYLYNKIFKK